MGTILQAEVEHALDTILRSDAFNASPQLSNFLEYVVRQALVGRPSEAFTPYMIATEALGRSSSFEADQDACVRVYGSRLREKLKNYYLGDAVSSHVRIKIPRHGYRPTFEVAGSDESAQDSFAHLDLRPTSSFPVIAVFPCRPIEFHAWEERFCRGLTEYLVLSLSRFDGLSVVPVGESRAIRKKTTDFSDFSRETIADFIILTDQIGATNKSMLMVKIVGSKTGRCLWTKLYDVDTSKRDISEVQSDLAGRIAASVASPFGHVHREAAWQSAGKDIERLTVYECLIQASLYFVTLDGSALNRGLESAQRAAKLSPDTALAWSTLAALQCEKYRLGLGAAASDVELLRSADTHVRRALLINPQSAHANLAKSCILFVQKRPDDAIEIGEHALQLNPANHIHEAEFGLFLAYSGAWQKGIAKVQRVAQRRHAATHRYLYPLVSNAYLSGNFEDALNVTKEIETPDFFVQHLNFAKCHAQLGEIEQAKHNLKMLRDMCPAYCLDDATRMLNRNFQKDMVDLSTEGFRLAGLA